MGEPPLSPGERLLFGGLVQAHRAMMARDAAEEAAFEEFWRVSRL